MAARPIVTVVNLGRMKYLKALTIQQKYHTILQKSSPSVTMKGNTLVLVEHEPVYTVGIRSGPYPIEEEERLKSYGADFVKTNRGGLITFHGVGQLVAYPIFALSSFPNLKNSIRCYVKAIENTCIRTCETVFRDGDSKLLESLKISTMEGYPGVWINESRKIAAIGVHSSNGITMHGTAINCNTDLKWFDHIVPCGIAGKGVTSFSQELNRDVTVGQVIPHFLEAFRDIFHCEFESEYEGEENIKSTRTV